MQTKSNQELLACLVGERPALYLARRPLKELERMGDAELKEVGLGWKKIAVIRALTELCRRYGAVDQKKGEKLTSPRTVFEIYRSRLVHEQKEMFLVVLLDTKNRVIKDEVVSMGGLNSTVVQAREVFALAVRERAAAVILIHNHPSGDPEPSVEDVDITRRLKEAGEMLGVEVLDHVVIGDEAYCSLKERGVL